MKSSLTRLVLAFGMASFGFVAIAAKLDNDKKKASYAIGQQIGTSLKSQGVDVDMDILSSSIKDYMAGKKSQLTPDEMTKAMMKLQSSMMEKQKAIGEENKKKGTTFLDANKKKEGVTVTKSGLQYKVVKEGTGATPKTTDTVVAQYKGTLIDGTEFDSSYKRGQPAEFPVTGVIPGWTEALQLMKVGEKVQLFIPSDLAYGEHGRPGIPPNSTLLFEIELVGIKEAPKTPAK